MDGFGGNEWVRKFTMIGVEWLSLYIPFTVEESSSSYSNSGDFSSSGTAQAAEKSLSKPLSVFLFKLYTGLAI
jgi:hypothetical protein